MAGLGPALSLIFKLNRGFKLRPAVEGAAHGHARHRDCPSPPGPPGSRVRRLGVPPRARAGGARWARLWGQASDTHMRQPLPLRSARMYARWRRIGRDAVLCQRGKDSSRREKREIFGEADAMRASICRAAAAGPAAGHARDSRPVVFIVASEVSESPTYTSSYFCGECHIQPIHHLP